jgi:hypothetical protein
MFFGPYGWVFDNLRALQTPIKIAGQMGLWEIPEEIGTQLLDVIESDPTEKTPDPRQISLFGGDL